MANASSTPTPAEYVVTVNIDTTTTHTYKFDVRAMVADDPDLWAKWAKRADITHSLRVERFVREYISGESPFEMDELPGYLPGSRTEDEHVDTDVTANADATAVAELSATKEAAPANVLDHTAELHRRRQELIAAGKSTKAVW